jgi:hypothetical protein
VPDRPRVFPLPSNSDKHHIKAGLSRGNGRPEASVDFPGREVEGLGEPGGPIGGVARSG